jgi:hypothetical protein
VTRREIARALAEYRRPGSPNYEYHFRRLPAEIVRKRNVRALVSILTDAGLPPLVREHAAGTLGEIGDERAVDPLVDALGDARLRRGAAVALGRMKAKAAAGALKALSAKVPAARWAFSQVGAAGSVEEAVDDMRSGQLRYISGKLASLPGELRKKVEQRIVRTLEADLERDGVDLRWQVTALGAFRHRGAPALLARTLKRAWRDMGPAVGSGSKKRCCGCLHARTLRALKVNPSTEAVPNLVETVTNHYQRHAAAALGRLRELDGGGLSDRQIARMVERSAAIAKPVGAHALAQVVRFAGDYGGAACRRKLESLAKRSPPGAMAGEIEAALRRLEGRTTVGSRGRRRGGRHKGSRCQG